MGCAGVCGKCRHRTFIPLTFYLCYTITSMQRRKEEAHHGATVITISTGTIFRVILIGLAAWFLYVIRDIVALMLISLLIAAVIDPFAERMKRFGTPRGVAVAGLYIVGFAVCIGALILVVPPTVQELGQVGEFLAPMLAQTPFGDLRTIFSGGTWTQNIAQIATTVQSAGLLQALPQFGQALQGAFGAVLAVLLVLVLAFYMVVEEHGIRRGIAIFTPAEYQPFVTQLSVKMRDKVGAWLRGQLLIMFLIAALDYIALTALGIPYALVLALFGGLVEVIPFLGPNLSVIPAVLVAFTVSPVHAALVLAAYFVIQQLESNVITPKVMQKTTGLNPIVTIVAILIGFQVDGIVGAVVSIPAAMIISVFYNEVFRTTTDESV